jgi:hypothetical protein
MGVVLAGFPVVSGTGAPRFHLLVFLVDREGVPEVLGGCWGWEA